MSDVSGMRGQIQGDWVDSAYYDQAETVEWLNPFWGADSRFLPLFNRLDLTAVVDLACGRGRHAAQFAGRGGLIALIDFNETNIEACRRRFANRPNTVCRVNAGNDIPLMDAT